MKIIKFNIDFKIHDTIEAVMSTVISPSDSEAEEVSAVPCLFYTHRPCFIQVVGATRFIQVVGYNNIKMLFFFLLFFQPVLLPHQCILCARTGSVRSLSPPDLHVYSAWFAATSPHT